MVKYRSKKINGGLKDDGYESGYQSDGGTKYLPTKHLGIGGNAEARLFSSISGKTAVVLNPVEEPGDIEEAKNKHRFFQTVYPERQSHLFIQDKDYRLAIPYLPYLPYNKIKEHDAEGLLMTLFRSAAQALKNCHEKRMIVVDLKLDNILYDFDTQKSYLIDGGLSAVIGTAIDPQMFQKANPLMVNKCRRTYPHIPPECWSVHPITALASPAMDVYSLGVLMGDLSQFLTFSNPETEKLINCCIDKNPRNRPTIIDLIDSLNRLIEWGPEGGRLRGEEPS